MDRGHALPPHAAFRRERDVREIEFRAIVAIAFGFVFRDVPGATRRHGLGVDRTQTAGRVRLRQAMSSPTIVTFRSPSRRAAPASPDWSCHRRSGTRRRCRSAPRADPRRRGSACARPASLRPARYSTQCAARSISFQAAPLRRTRSRKTDLPRFGKVDHVLVGLHGHGTSASPGASGAPTLCMHGTRAARCDDLPQHGQADARHDLHAHHDVWRVRELRAMRDIGESIAPMLKASTYIVRPAIAPANIARRRARISNGLTQCGRAGVVLRQRADEGPRFDPCDVARIRLRVENPATAPGSAGRTCRPGPFRHRAGRIPPAIRPPSGWSSAARDPPSCAPAQQMGVRGQRRRHITGQGV